MGHAGNKIDEVWQQISRIEVVAKGRNLQVAKVGLAYPTTQTGDLWLRGSPWGSKILKGVKNCNAFLRGDFTDNDEIWHDGGFRGQLLSDFGKF